ncbi:MAG: DUF885 domain-containing protein [Gammaproteobacteria bacterium]|nr:DUF885 domain-containing protein [Gammaproteobacteria bacterium]
MRLHLSAVLTAALLVACAKAPPAAPAPHGAAAEDWPQFAQRFIEESFRADPYFAVTQGRHEFDGQMPDWSRAALEAEVQRLVRARAQAAAFPESALTEEQRYEREYLYTVIDTDLFARVQARAPFKNPAWYVGALDPDIYLNGSYAAPEVRLRGYLGYARAMPHLAEQIRANLETPLPASFVAFASDSFGGFAEFFREEVTPAFAAVRDPQLQAQLAAADAAAADAMDRLTAWLKGQRASATQDFALGTPLLLQMLRVTERVDLPFEQLQAIGRADLERNTQALREACARFLPHAALQACVDRMQAHKPQGGAVEGARTQLAALRAFVIEHRVVSVPSEEQAQVAEAPAYNRSNGAYINTPGAYEKSGVATYFIAPPDPRWTARERAAYIPGRANLLYTSVHEVWPGHFLQYLHSNRSASKIEAIWWDYAFGEGWAHYAEELMWEEGLGEGDAEQHVGQLVNALERDVRFLSSLGLHSGTMSVADSERMFRTQAFTDAGTAQQQAERGTYDPEYLKYTLGKLMIRKMRDDWVAQHPPAGGADPRTTWQAFHDALLAHGSPPLPLLRQRLLGGGAIL